MITDVKTNHALGMSMIASVAGSIIAQAAKAMELGATSEDIAYTCHAHLTHGKAFKGAAIGALGKAIHI